VHILSPITCCSPVSISVILRAGNVTQQLQVNNPQQMPVRLLLRLTYNGQVKQHEVTNMPANAI